MSEPAPRFPDFDAFAAGIPLAGILDLRALVDDDAGRTRLALEPRDDLLQTAGVVHGGILATLADTAGVWAVLRDLSASRTLTSISFQLNFLRPARRDAGELVAVAEVLRRGARVAVVDVEVRQSGAAVARGSFTYLVLEA